METQQFFFPVVQVHSKTTNQPYGEHFIWADQIYLGSLQIKSIYPVWGLLRKNSMQFHGLPAGQ